MRKYLCINPNVFSEQIMNETRRFTPIIDIIRASDRHRLCNKWINQLLKKKYGGKQ